MSLEGDKVGVKTRKLSASTRVVPSMVEKTHAPKVCYAVNAGKCINIHHHHLHKSSNQAIKFPK